MSEIVSAVPKVCLLSVQIVFQAASIEKQDSRSVSRGSAPPIACRSWRGNNHFSVGQLIQYTNDIRHTRDRGCAMNFEP
jgi:hypothetical protein